MKAIFIKDVSGGTGYKKLYRLNPPLDGNEYVVVSATATMFSGPETYIFPSDSTGIVKKFGVLNGSFRGEMDHNMALKNAGYNLEDGLERAIKRIE